MNKRAICILAAIILLARLTPICAAGIDETVEKLKSSPSNSALLGNLAQGAMTEASENKKAKALVICYTGYLLLNKPQIADKAKAILMRDCAISGYAQMLETNALIITTNCQTCEGTSKTEIMCAACRNIPLRDGYTRCHGCNGRGSRPGIGGRTSKCASCLGKKICTKCNGSGKTEKACKDCKNGKISNLDRKKALDLYKVLLNE